MTTGNTKVYDFPNGFRAQAENMYGWLRHYGFTPSWCEGTEHEGWNGTGIAIPPGEVSQLRKLQETNPARWGSPTTAA